MHPTRFSSVHVTGRVDFGRTALAAYVGFAAMLASVFAPRGAGAQLLHEYTFASGATDRVGTANGTLVGGATAAGGMLTLTGSGQYVQFGQHVVPTTGSYSVSLFETQTTAASGFTEFLSQGYSGGPGFYVGLDPTGQVRVTDTWTSTGVRNLSVGAPHNLVLTVDATAHVSDLYVDGLLAATLNQAITTTAGGTDTRFGRQFDCCVEQFLGTLQDVRVYGNALSAADVGALYAAGPATGAGATVPEPSTWLLLGAGLAGLAGIAHARARAASWQRRG